MPSMPALITPLEPGSPRGWRVAARAPAVGHECAHTGAFHRIEVAVASSCGSLHDANEDAYSGPDGPGRLFVVADGVGGGAMARMASRQLVRLLHGALDEHRVDAARIRRAMLEADREIAESIAQVADQPGAATVVLCAPANLLATRWWVGWVGDCRVYRLALGAGAPAFELLTRDDTFRHMNESPPAGSSLDDPARMVGNGATSGASAAVHSLARGDMLVLCSDGVHKYVPSHAWARVLTLPGPLARRCEDLIALARRNGSTDDATVMLLQHGGFAIPRPRWALPSDAAARGSEPPRTS
jgi:protein phosphatase